jgi:HSP20 family molecular chaperone IbpA
MNKTQWLDWLEAGAGRLQERYREAWNRGPRASKQASGAQEPKQWSAIHPEIDRELREVVVHLELPEPHTVEAAVRVIGSTLAISVLRTGSHVERAPAQDCYRRAIPLPPKVNPESATHKIHGDELVIRLQPRVPKRRTTKPRSAAARESTAAGDPAAPEPRQAKTAQRRRAAPSAGERKRSSPARSR